MSSCRRSGCTHRSQAVLVARAAMHWTLHLCLNYSRYIQRQISICYVIRFICIIRKSNRLFLELCREELTHPLGLAYLPFPVLIVCCWVARRAWCDIFWEYYWAQLPAALSRSVCT